MSTETSLGVATNQRPGNDTVGDMAQESTGSQELVRAGEIPGPSAQRTATALTSMSLVPTLFPAPVANLITTLATSTRLSLRLSAFFIEAILETSQFSTRLSLGYTRRLLITALSSARRVYLMSNAAFEGDILGLLGFGEDKSAPSLGSDAFLQVLDKYTNLGIYIIHHTFTLAELFAMSGFYLTANAVQSAHFAAQESVALFDSLFGSNESSRALSSIITLVRKELLEDERFKAKDKGKIASLAALTKALTAFACLQSSTWKRTEAKLKLRIIHDCTVVEDSVRKSAHNGAADPTLTAPARLSDDGGDIGLLLNNETSIPEMSPPVNLSHEAGRPGMRAEESNRPTTDPSTLMEITDETTESTTVTQTLTVRDLEAMGLSFTSDHRRGGTFPLTSASGSKNRKSGEFDTHQSPGCTDEDNEWIEVLSDEDEIPSLPNGTSSVGSTAYRDALDHPSANSERIQFVLKTITSKFSQRKRVIRTLPGQNQIDTTQPRVALAEIEWAPSATGINNGGISASTSDSTVSHDAHADSRSNHNNGLVSSSSSLMSRTRSGGESSSTPMKRAMSKAKTAFKPLTSKKRVTRPSSLQKQETARPTLRRKGSSRVGEEDENRVEEVVVPKVPPNSVELSPERIKRSRPTMTTVHESVQTASHRMQSATTKAPPVPGTPGSADSLFPHDSLVKNLHRFMRFSSAAYGQNFLRIFGMGDTEYNFPSTGQHHANSWSFAQHTKIPIDSLLLSSYTDTTPISNQKAPPLIHYVSVDHDRAAVILTCRGTLGLSDVLIDLTCDYCNIEVEGSEPHGEYYVHSGMYQSALALTRRESKVHEVLAEALESNPTYGLVLTGHSLGGGVAALLAIACSTPSSVFKAAHVREESKRGHPDITTPFVTSTKCRLPAGRPIHCYAFGPPAVTSPDLSKWARGLITSTVHGSDVVPTLSLGVLRDLKNVALTLYEEGMVAEEIVGRVIGVYQRKFSFQQDGNGESSIPPSSDDQALSDWTMSLIKTMRADMDSDKLYPPGDVYLLEYFDVCQIVHEKTPHNPTEGQSTSEKKARRVILRHCESVHERFREPLFSKTMLNDHLPLHYERSTQLLLDGVTRDTTHA